MSKTSFGQSISDLADSIRRYLEIRLNLAKLEIMEKSARFISLSIVAVFLLSLFMLFLLFISFAAANWFGQLMNSPALGYLSIAGFYLLLIFIVLLLRRKLFLGTVIRHLSEIFFEEKSIKKEDE